MLHLAPPVALVLSSLLPQVREAVEALQNEGHIYTTTDENHFKSCNAA